MLLEGDGRVPAGRVKAFRSIAWFMGFSAVAFGLFTAVFGIVSEAQEIHAFHNTVVAALLLILSAAPAIAAASRPERAAAPLLHLLVLSIAGLATMVLSLKLDFFTLPFIILVAAGAIPLLSYALGQAELQRIDTSSEHAEFNHWVETASIPWEFCF